jgi:hypothetical protein
MEAANKRSVNGSTDRESASASKYDFRSSTSAAPEVGNDTNSPVTSPISPPYWVQGHQRSFSSISVESVPNGGITLQDNTDGEDAKNKACWAKSVQIEDHVIINGNRTGIGAFVVWNINVETLQVSCHTIAILRQLLTGHREAQCEFENDTRNLMTCGTNSFKPSQIQRLLCHPYPERA